MAHPPTLGPSPAAVRTWTRDDYRQAGIDAHRIGLLPQQVADLARTISDTMNCVAYCRGYHDAQFGTKE